MKEDFLLYVSFGHGYDILPDGSVDSTYSVTMDNMGLNVIPVKFRKVNGYFDCSYNQLTTLKNFPDEVNNTVYIEVNKKQFTKKEVRAVCKVENIVV
jgi:hypothetical protein